MSIEVGAIARHDTSDGNTKRVRVEDQKILVHTVDDAGLKMGPSRWVRLTDLAVKGPPQKYKGATILSVEKRDGDLVVVTTRGTKKLPEAALERL